MAIDVEQALWEEARRRAAAHGYPLEPGAEHHLFQFVRESANRMEQAGVNEPGPEMDDVVEKLHELVDLMADEVVRQGYAEFHEPTFFAARDRFCQKRPNFWPFCKATRT